MYIIFRKFTKTSYHKKKDNGKIIIEVCFPRVLSRDPRPLYIEGAKVL